MVENMFIKTALEKLYVELEVIRCLLVQGSTLCPISSIVYSNNISKLTINDKLFLFEDDSLTFIRGHGWHDVGTKTLNDTDNGLKKRLDQNVLF